MDAGAKPDTRHDPYGVFGLCVSLAAAIVLATLLMAATGGIVLLAMILDRGWPGARDALRAFVAMLGSGDNLNSAQLAIGLAFYVGMIGAILLLARWRGGADWRSLVAWRAPAWPLKDKIVWAIGAAAILYSFASTALLGYFYPKSESWFSVPPNHVSAGLLLVLAVVLAPLAEEIFFRGWIYTSLRFHWGFWPAALISSALFALAHYEGTHLYALVVFPLGMALAALRERTGSVRTSMIFHAFNNFLAFGAAALAIGQS